jgi:hypothetical protein
VARATLGNESVSIGSGGGMGAPGSSRSSTPIPSGWTAAPRVGRYNAHDQALGLLNLRSARGTRSASASSAR